MNCTADWLTGFCVGATLAQLIGESVSAIIHNFLEIHSALPKKEKKITQTDSIRLPTPIAAKVC